MIAHPSSRFQNTSSIRKDCPSALSDYPEIVLGHGGGGRLSQELVEHLFLPAFDNPELRQLADSTVLEVEGQRLAFSTDSFVVRPLFFPGGSIAELAVNGTVNDLAMSGAKPLYLSVGLIVEEGLPVEHLSEIVSRMADAARQAGVAIVAGDTKVVEHGHGDGLYINTSGIGLVPAGIQLSPRSIRPGDAILVSGTVGDHGMAVMSVREGLEFSSPIVSDSIALNSLVQSMLEICPSVRMLRDPTRGGVATSLNEIATAAGVGMLVHEQSIPVDQAVGSACEMLGIDPLFVANEGKLLAIVPEKLATKVLQTMRATVAGRGATIIGTVIEECPGRVVLQTSFGGTRFLNVPLGEQLPRIC